MHPNEKNPDIHFIPIHMHQADTYDAEVIPSFDIEHIFSSFPWLLSIESYDQNLFFLRVYHIVPSPLPPLPEKSILHRQGGKLLGGVGGLSFLF